MLCDWRFGTLVRPSYELRRQFRRTPVPCPGTPSPSKPRTAPSAKKVRAVFQLHASHVLHVPASRRRGLYPCRQKGRSCCSQEVRAVAPELASTAACESQQEDPTRRPPIFTLGLHGAISEGRAQAEASGCVVGMASFYVDGAVCVTHKVTKTFLDGFQKGILAKPLPSSVHAVEAPWEWTIRHDKCFSLLGAALGPPTLLLRKLLDKLDWAEKLMAQLSRLQSTAFSTTKTRSDRREPCRAWQSPTRAFGRCVCLALHGTSVWHVCMEVCNVSVVTSTEKTMTKRTYLVNVTERHAIRHLLATQINASILTLLSYATLNTNSTLTTHARKHQ